MKQTLPTINVRLLQRIAHRIEATPDKYDQSIWEHPCGSPACVAGWACHLYEWSEDETPPSNSEEDLLWGESEIATSAKSALGLTNAESWMLFRRQWPAALFRWANCEDADRIVFPNVEPAPDDAVRVLRAIADRPDDFRKKANAHLNHPRYALDSFYPGAPYPGTGLDP